MTQTRVFRTIRALVDRVFRIISDNPQFSRAVWDSQFTVTETDRRTGLELVMDARPHTFLAPITTRG